MLLAFDTSSPTVSVALHDGRSVVAEQVSQRPMKHGEQLAPLIASVLAEAGVDRTELTRIGVGAGPGPFTGLRVGLVTARTLGFVLGVPVSGACGLDILAFQAVTAPAGVDGEFLVATDARRKEVYWARYDAAGTRQDGPQVAAPASLTDLIGRYSTAARTMPVLGEGAALYPEQLGPAHEPLRPSAGSLAAALVADAIPVLDPEPLYLRRPDAVEAHRPKPVS